MRNRNVSPILPKTKNQKPKTNSKQALVLYSGGLDSRLAIRLLQDQGFQITALQFILPFGCSACKNIPAPKNINLITLNTKQEPLLSEYLQILKNPRHGTGSGINPCKDCKIFMFKKAYECAKQNNIKVIATGEVLGQRPMSQIGSAIKTIDEDLDFEILRPLSAKKLKETEMEKSGLIDRNKLLEITGRGRKEQIKLAKKYDLQFPDPAGGCFLCESAPVKRLKFLLKNNLINETTLPLVTIGRHFSINNTWLVVARNAYESDIITTFPTHIPDEKGKPSIYYSNESEKEKALELQDAYSTGDNLEKRAKFDKYKL